MAKRNFKAEIRSLIREKWAERDWDTAELARAVALQLLDDPEFRLVAGIAFVEPIAAMEARIMAAQDRRSVPAVGTPWEAFTGATVGKDPKPDAFIVVGRTLTTRRRMRDKAAKELPTWAVYRENAGRRYISILDMTKEQLLAAAERREKQANTNTQRALFLRLVATKLQPGQAVRVALTNEQLSILYSESIKQKERHNGFLNSYRTGTRELVDSVQGTPVLPGAN